ncbi:hypothetical protein BD310DRAFT_676773 [Dichomitus squalens]|uniref:Uncharacterized protein n=1 Tax=Dichomitus squalens TaxID=114155 RepID=A0A4V2K7C9_9APHY|nr:hypothetical protein BD310DRAFT_676773 [Dichomitus squalens]
MFQTSRDLYMYSVQMFEVIRGVIGNQSVEMGGLVFTVLSLHLYLRAWTGRARCSDGEEDANEEGDDTDGECIGCSTESAAQSRFLVFCFCAAAGRRVGHFTTQGILFPSRLWTALAPCFPLLPSGDPTLLRWYPLLRPVLPTQTSIFQAHVSTGSARKGPSYACV